MQLIGQTTPSPPPPTSTVAKLTHQQLTLLLSPQQGQAPSPWLQSLHQSNLWRVSNFHNTQQSIQTLIEIYKYYAETSREETFLKDLRVLLGGDLGSRVQDIFRGHLKLGRREEKLFERCHCKNSIFEMSSAVQCPTCEKKYHKGCVFGLSLRYNRECSVCKIMRLDPLVHVQEVKSYGVIDDSILGFTSTQNLLVEDDEFVHIRSIKLSPKPSQNNQLCWPDGCSIKLNGTERFLFSPISLKHSLKKRPDFFAELNRQQYLRRTRVEISATRTYDEKMFRVSKCPFLIVVLVVKHLSHREVAQNALKNLQHKIVSICRFRQMFLWSAIYPEITLEREKISLICPISKQRMKIPTRGNLCQHVECFDMMNFLAINEKSRGFKCPIFRCSERCHGLVVDPVIYEVIREDTGGEVREVEYNLEGVKVYKRIRECIVISSDEEQENEEVEGHEQTPITTTCQGNSHSSSINMQLSVQPSMINDKDAFGPKQQPPTEKNHVNSPSQQEVILHPKLLTKLTNPDIRQLSQTEPLSPPQKLSAQPNKLHDLSTVDISSTQPLIRGVNINTRHRTRLPMTSRQDIQRERTNRYVSRLMDTLQEVERREEFDNFRQKQLVLGMIKEVYGRLFRKPVSRGG